MIPVEFPIRRGRSATDPTFLFVTVEANVVLVGIVEGSEVSWAATGRAGLTADGTLPRPPRVLMLANDALALALAGPTRHLCEAQDLDRVLEIN